MTCGCEHKHLGKPHKHKKGFNPLDMNETTIGDTFWSSSTGYS